MPTLILSNPLGADDAQRIGLDIREYAVGEIVAVSDFAATTLIRTGYGLALGNDVQTLIVGTGPPNESVGVDGQWYLDSINEVLWGPKAGGLWPSDPIRPDRGVQQISLIGDRLQVTYSTGTTVDLGRIRFVSRGDWAAGVAYAVDDMVQANGATFRVTAAHTSTGSAPTPAAPGANYEVFAATPNATTTSRGAVRLAGDLAGTADAPTVPGLADKATTAALTSLANAVVPLTQRGAADGVATLDGSGKIPTGQLPALALTDTKVVASQAAMLALTGIQPGDIAVRTDGAGTFILTATDPSVLGNWQRLNAPTDVVTSVAGRVGAVTLASADITDATAAATVNTLAKRDANGRFAVAAGSAAGDAVNLGQLTTFGRDLGTGTTLPATGPGSSALRRGDVYYHTGLFCLMVYNGAAWRQVHPAICTAAQRGLMTDAMGLHDRFMVHESDTGVLLSRASSAWRVLDGAGFARYSMTTNASGFPVTTANAKVPFGVAEDTHADVTRSADNLTFTFNRAGVWRIDLAFRYGGAPDGSRNQIMVASGDQTVVYIAQTELSGSAQVFDIAVGTTRRFSAGDTVSLGAYTSVASGVVLDTTSGAAQRNNVAFTYLRS